MFTIPGDPLSVKADILGYIAGMPISNTMLMAGFDLILFFLLCVAVSRFSVTKPGKFQLVVENILDIITGLISQIVGDRKVAQKIMPLVATLVVFILVSNLAMTFLPILTGFTFDGKPLFRSHTNDFNTTLALALGMVILTQLFSIYKNNPFGYIFKFIQIPQIINGFRKGFGEGFTAIIGAFIGILDIISEFAKIISLSLRLFGNMFAGELLIGILMSMFAIILPIPILGLSLLSGAVQAIVFGALVASFFAGVLKEE
jgi:F-type H+-transporting ATPase subunit a